MPGAPKEVEILSFGEVLSEERELYLDARRELNGLAKTDAQPDLWGIGLSGGGIRSATFCLGVLQAFITRRILKRFDYLSTVSGGGYIGSCLSSIFAGELKDKDKGLSLEPEGSPFVDLRATQGYQTSEETQMSVQHQMHHLRSHGEYLIPRSGLLSRDFQRFLGTGGLGICYTFLVFFVALALVTGALHLVFTAVDPELTHLSPPGELQLRNGGCLDPCDQGFVSKWTGFVRDVASSWWSQRVMPPLLGILASALAHPVDLLGMALLAVVWASIWLFLMRRRARVIARLRAQPSAATKPGWTDSEMAQARLQVAYNAFSVGIAILATLWLSVRGSKAEGDYLGALALPIVFSLAAWTAAFLAMSIGETWRDMRNKANGARKGSEEEAQIRRSLYDAVGGANLLGLAAAMLVPIVSVLAFSLARLPGKFYLACILAGAGFWVTRSQKARVLDTSRFLGPALDGLVLLFLLITFSRVSGSILSFHRGHELTVAWGSAVVVLVGTAALLFLGFLFDPNRISPQHFYSDRLAEAYLRTDARVRGSEQDRNYPLTTIRNDEQLELARLGTPTRAPLHLIVAALNLADSEELVRKRTKSDHFVSSGLHVGSRATGFVRTSDYRSGRTRLATALATSAAAVSSAAGLNTRRSVAFLATLFNGRLGLWIENPAKYARGGNPTRPFTFWPHRLLQEVFGWLSERTRLVNVSDGAHTGDNLGLMPLLQRRCKVIVVCDAEADGHLDFNSLRNVVRMANVELNVTLDLDLGSVQRTIKCDEGYCLSEASVLEGVVHYPETRKGDGSTASAFKGRLIYIKSSVSRCSRVVVTPPSKGPEGSEGLKSSTPLPQDRTLPVSVASYLRANAHFPHQTTADQFFDDAQFEAYRALGFYSGNLATGALEGQP